MLALFIEHNKIANLIACMAHELSENLGSLRVDSLVQGVSLHELPENLGPLHMDSISKGVVVTVVASTAHQLCSAWKSVNIRVITPTGAKICRLL